MSKKSNLFKFVTLRNPQLLDEDRKEQGFVFHPEVDVSQFYADTTSGNPEQRYGKLKTRCETLLSAPPQANYISLNRTKLRASFPNLTKFSTWFSKNNTKLNPYAIKTFIETSSIVTLDDQSETRLWDNLIYQTITNQSKPVRESIIKLLIANQFLSQFKNKVLTSVTAQMTEFTEEFKDEFVRRAKANVAVPNIFLPDFSKDVPTVPTLSSFLTNRLEKEMEAAVAKERKAAYEISLHAVKIEAQEALKAQIAAKETVYNDYLADAKQYKEDHKVVTSVDNGDGTTSEVVTYPSSISVTPGTIEEVEASDLISVINGPIRSTPTRSL